MTTKKKLLITLIIAITTAVAGLVCSIVACVMAFNTARLDYSHNIKIKKIETQHATEQGVVFYMVTIDGELYNNTDKDHGIVNLEIAFEGVDNKSGQPSEFLSGITLEHLYANSKTNISDKKIKVGTQRGFIPESIKSIKLVLSDERVEVPFKEEHEGSLLLFASALALLFVSGLVFAKWNNGRKKLNSNN